MVDPLRARPRPVAIALVATALGVHERVARDRAAGSSPRPSRSRFFLSLFPLLLVAIAVLGFVAADNADLAADLIDDLGLTGDVADLADGSIDAAESSRAATTILGFVGLLWAAVGLAGGVQQVCDRPWQVPARGITGMAGRRSGGCSAPSSLLGGAIVVTGLLPGAARRGWRRWGRRPGLALSPPSSCSRSGCSTTTPLPLARAPARARRRRRRLQLLTLFGTLIVPHCMAERPRRCTARSAWCSPSSPGCCCSAACSCTPSCLNVVLHERAHGTVHVEVEVPRFAGEVPLPPTRSGAVSPRQG